MGSTHVVAVPLGTSPSLLSPLVIATDWQCCRGCGAIRGNGRIFIYNATERPARTGVLRCRSENRMSGLGDRKSLSINFI